MPVRPEISADVQREPEPRGVGREFGSTGVLNVHAT